MWTAKIGTIGIRIKVAYAVTAKKSSIEISSSTFFGLG